MGSFRGIAYIRVSLCFHLLYLSHLDEKVQGKVGGEVKRGGSGRAGDPHRPASSVVYEIGSMSGP